MRVAPLEEPLRTSDQPVSVPAAWSMLSDELLFTLSKIRFASDPGNVKRNTAAWSVGAISVFRPFSKVTP